MLTAGFDADTALEPLGDGRFAGHVPRSWFVGRGPNGSFERFAVARRAAPPALLADENSPSIAPPLVAIRHQKSSITRDVERSIEVASSGPKPKVQYRAGTGQGKCLGIELHGHKVLLPRVDNEGSSNQARVAALPGQEPELAVPEVEEPEPTMPG